MHVVRWNVLVPFQHCVLVGRPAGCRARLPAFASTDLTPRRWLRWRAKTYYWQEALSQPWRNVLASVVLLSSAPTILVWRDDLALAWLNIDRFCSTYLSQSEKTIVKIALGQKSGMAWARRIQRERGFVVVNKRTKIVGTKELYRNGGDDFESVSSPNLGQIGQACRTGAIHNNRAILSVMSASAHYWNTPADLVGYIT